ncbi:MAG: WYL domain-containing protein [Nannocystaceae bacterium]|nr:WYL domain-containing protein [Nannocystaceae bacterium]
MTRVDRVLDLLDLLRGAQTLTVADIAEELACSRRTVLRDLASLRERGWPIVGEGGPGGGIRLERDRGVAAVHLTTEEVAALWLSTRLSASASNVPWSGAARSGLRKVFASVPAERRRALRSLVDRVKVGRPATAQVRAELGTTSDDLLGALERAFTRSLCVSFGYTDRRGRRTRRRVEPHGLLVETPAWYLLARDVVTGNARTFRFDRIEQARVLTSQPFRPDFEALRAEAMGPQT